MVIKPHKKSKSNTFTSSFSKCNVEVPQKSPSTRENRKKRFQDEIKNLYEVKDAVSSIQAKIDNRLAQNSRNSNFVTK